MTRRRCRWGTLLMALVATAMPLWEGHARPPLELGEATVVSGRVQSASADELVLITDRDRSSAGPATPGLPFVVIPETEIRWGIQPLTAVELRRGDLVTVRYHEQSGRKVATAIWALMARARELSPTETADTAAEAAYARANRLLDNAQFRQALPHLNRAIHLRPGFLAAYSRRGYLYATLAVLETDRDAQQRARKRALVDYTTAIDEGSKRGLMAANWYNNRGVLYQQLEDHQHALEDFTAALRVEPTYLVALQNRARLRRTVGDWEGALADFTQVIGLEPEVGQWYCQRGLVWRRQEAIARAYKDFQRCLTLDPSLREQYPEAVDGLRDKPPSEQGAPRAHGS